MIMIQFKHEEHEKNMNLLHRIKKDIHELCESLEKCEQEAYDERRYIIDQYDEAPRRHYMDERRGGLMSRRDNRSIDRHYPEYPFDERAGGRYNY